LLENAVPFWGEKVARRMQPAYFGSGAANANVSKVLSVVPSLRICGALKRHWDHEEGIRERLEVRGSARNWIVWDVAIEEHEGHGISLPRKFEMGCEGGFRLALALYWVVGDLDDSRCDA
jgi:hypothetical protein